MNVTINQIINNGKNLRYSFLYKVLSPICNGQIVVGMGLTNSYNANLIDYAIELHMKRLEASKSNSREMQIRRTKKLVKELREAVKNACK